MLVMRGRTFIIMAVSLLVALGLAAYFAYQSFFSPEAQQRREVTRWVTVIGERVMLPHGERPTLATVTNREKLDGQAFFQKAEQGDKILIYPHASRAYLYRPSTGKIIEMASEIEIERDGS